MKTPPIPHNETERLQALLDYSILDSLPEAEYEDITRLASEICGTPISSIGLIDDNRQWFKSKVGFEGDQTSRENSFCGHAIVEPDKVFTVTDSRTDERFHDHPAVTGDPHVVFYMGVPLVNPEGFAVGALCVVDDKPRELTPQQIAALKALSKQVVTLFELRKSKLKLEKLANDLKTRNVELERFAQVAAHDIKSPLSNISSLAQILITDYARVLDPAAIELLNMLDSSSHTLRKLVDGILEHSKTDGIIAEKRTRFHVDTLVKQTTSLLDKSGQYDFRFSYTDQEIYANYTGLQQILLNLVANAIKYNDKKKVEIEIGFVEKPETYTFFVSDNGSGIRPESLGRIFNIFEVLSTTDRFGERGSGIGLSTVKKLAEGLGGSVKVTSEPGRGSRFSFAISKFNFL